jgi:DNA-binding GntR family transcriptional regulator
VNPTPTFDRAYGEIRRRVLSGAWLPGQRIDLPQLADALGASTTPVRDALNRMVGERLLTTGIGDGFAMPPMTEPDLHDLYDWHHQLVVLATRGRKPGRLAAGGGRDGDGEDNATFAALFATIAARSDNLEMRAAIASAEARLAPVRLAEERLFATAEELAGLRRTLAEDDMAGMRTQLAAWHRRRVQAAGRIIHLLHRPETAPLSGGIA